MGDENTLWFVQLETAMLGTKPTAAVIQAMAECLNYAFNNGKFAGKAEVAKAVAAAKKKVQKAARDAISNLDVENL